MTGSDSSTLASLLAWCSAAEVWIDPRIQVVDNSASKDGEAGDTNGVCVFSRDKAIDPFTTREYASTKTTPSPLYSEAWVPLTDHISIGTPFMDNIAPLSFRTFSLCRLSSREDTQSGGTIYPFMLSIRADPKRRTIRSRSATRPLPCVVR